MRLLRILDYWRGKDLNVDRLHRLSDLGFEDCAEIAWLLRRFRRQRFLLAFSFSLILGFCCYLGLVWLVQFLADENPQQFNAVANPVLSVFVASMTLIYLLKKSRWTEVSFEHWLDYLDNHYAGMNRSGALLAKASDELNPIEKLQKQRTVKFVSRLLNTPQYSLLPQIFNYPKRYQLIVLVIGAMLLGFAYTLRGSAVLEVTVDDDFRHQSESPVEPLNIEKLEVKIDAPEYTGIGHYISQSPQIQAISGSSITWTLSLNQEVNRAIIQLSDDSEVNFTAKGNGVYEAKQVVNQTLTYRFVFSQTVEQQSPMVVTDSQYTIEAINDRAPVVRVSNPKKTITELDRNSEPTISLAVEVFDDFGLQDAHILASIAKGSGEAVKFRDLQLGFDETGAMQPGKDYQGLDFSWFNEALAAGNVNSMAGAERIAQSGSGDMQIPRYQLSKRFDLSTLAMEPGDELYFTVVAIDNRLPQAAETRSRTYILRWLDEDNSVILADGMVLELLPEYFKSQRQIIIETKQLIAESQLLSEQEFNHTSKQLGFAQSDLKVKYGQYLGDEHEGVNASTSSNHVESAEENDGHDHDANQQGEDDHESGTSEPFDLTGPGVEHGQQPIAAGDGGHSHESLDQGGPGIERDLSGANDLINTFGHAHEDVDVGVYNALDPKALMKMALSFMWQAELELMLHRPDKALPHEEQALAYLTRAQKADRIYVKRLGFEPPPVSEERRYQGDMSEINHINEKQVINVSDDELLGIYQQMQSLSLSHWSDKNTNLIEQVLQVFNQRLQDQPELIQFVSKSQQLHAQQSMLPENCQTCWQEIKSQVYRMLPELDKSMHRRQSFLLPDLLLPNKNTPASASEQHRQQP
ncbi:hypothetical protein [Thalassotalea mangrovi]|uniref:DUF4175 domain-containing protein n=1 Tax=Thalassotalea mangrovi TaxID=2572245 RepID=A0A4U1B363_9GAMM|nr:hypothetical protein [Thalassotalea mangrovi]TKB44344.1 hypothetical protein E8M12_11880 [Thalassotalea mangrovi]